MATTTHLKEPRKVRFYVDGIKLNSEVILVPPRSELTEEDKKNLWFARSDYHFSRSAARVISKESERYGYSKNLDAVYGVDNPDVRERLNQWALHGHSRRGLERWANASHGEARKEDQCKYIKGVVRSQHEMILKGELDADRLRDICHEVSRKSRIFAQLMGEADAHATRYAFGMIDSPHAQTRYMRSSGLSTGAKVNRVSDLTNSIPRPRLESPQLSTKKTSPMFSINRRPGRVPRIA